MKISLMMFLYIHTHVSLTTSPLPVLDLLPPLLFSISTYGIYRESYSM